MCLSVATDARPRNLLVPDTRFLFSAVLMTTYPHSDRTIFFLASPHADWCYSSHIWHRFKASSMHSNKLQEDQSRVLA